MTAHNTDAAENYIAINKKLWNEKTKHHVHSAFYDLSAFLNGKSSLNEIELALLGDVKGKSILHLQCHFGQDSLSLAGMGAEVTGVDLSDEAIKKAEELAQQLQLRAARPALSGSSASTVSSADSHALIRLVACRPWHARTARLQRFRPPR